LNVEIVNFVKVLGVKNVVSKPSLFSRHTRISIYKTLSRPTVCYVSELWTIITDENSILLWAQRNYDGTYEFHKL
jgi:hypothetical protein